MDILGMVALVVAITQVLKLKIGIDPNIIAVIVSIGVVAYKVVETGTPWTVGLVVIWIQVIVGAVGSFKVGKEILSPTK